MASILFKFNVILIVIYIGIILNSSQGKCKGFLCCLGGQKSSEESNDVKSKGNGGNNNGGSYINSHVPTKGNTKNDDDNSDAVCYNAQTGQSYTQDFGASDAGGE